MGTITSYNGGPILTQMRPMALWATVTWADGTESLWHDQSLRCSMDQFFYDILDSSYLEQLSRNFSISGKTIGGGPFLGTTGLGIEPGVNRGTVFDDSVIQAALAQAAVVDQILPWPTAETCYFVFLPTDVRVSFQGDVTGVVGGTGGYHNSFQAQDGRTILYCVVSPPREDLNMLTQNTSHELAEQITDPVPGTGWIGPPDPFTGALQRAPRGL